MPEAALYATRPDGFHYAVAGRWPFPADMLRRDGSVPATDADRDAVEALSADRAPDHVDALREVVTVHLVIPGAGPLSRPETARWRSFGWTVPGDGFAAGAEGGATTPRDDGSAAPDDLAMVEDMLARLKGRASARQDAPSLPAFRAMMDAIEALGALRSELGTPRS